MSPKHVLLPILLAVIVAATVANELHPRTWKSAVEVSSFHSNSEPYQDIWKLKEADSVTLENDKTDEELVNGYERRGLSDSVEEIEPNHKHKRCKCRRHCHRGKAPTPAPAQAPSVASFDEFEEEGYELEGGKGKFCKCKHKPKPKPKPKSKPHPIPPTQPPAEAPAVF